MSSASVISIFRWNPAAVVAYLDAVDEVRGGIDGDGGGVRVEGVVDEFFDESDGIGEDLAGAKGADGGVGEGLDWHWGSFEEGRVKSSLEDASSCRKWNVVRWLPRRTFHHSCKYSEFGNEEQIP